VALLYGGKGVAGLTLIGASLLLMAALNQAGKADVTNMKEVYWFKMMWIWARKRCVVY
jgi:hypothetical protein